MNELHYTTKKNTQMLIGLLKAHGIKKVIASPGTQNMSFIGSIQNDDYFEIYSSVDERSAAYIACGLAASSGEPVVLSCTGATASRNYAPGMTEAYYRKLPVLAVTSGHHPAGYENYVAQFVDRTQQMNDITNMSVQITEIYSKEEEWAMNVLLNRALLELTHNGGGPVHINLHRSEGRDDYSVQELPEVRAIYRTEYKDKLPPITQDRVAVYVGSHLKWSEELTQAADEFCKAYNGVMLCDHTSNYRGKYRVEAPVLSSQNEYLAKCTKFDLMIHIGCVSGGKIRPNVNRIWRVNPDGYVRDTFRKLERVFQMEELYFFKKYVDLAEGKEGDDSFYKEWHSEYENLISNVSDLPLSNVWVAYNTVSKIPQNSCVYYGINNSLRAWNFFETDDSLLEFSNTGGYGIDGGVSTLFGLSLSDRERLCFGVVGDLGFFYDMNVLGNREMGRNFRLLVINNGKGTEFRNYHHASAIFGDDADKYIAAAGHFGNKSENLIKHYAEDLGFEYLSAKTKEEYLEKVDRFTVPELTEKPMVFEVFTNSTDESNAIKMMNTLDSEAKGKMRSAAKNLLGDKTLKKVKKIIGK